MTSKIENGWYVNNLPDMRHLLFYIQDDQCTHFVNISSSTGNVKIYLSKYRLIIRDNHILRQDEYEITRTIDRKIYKLDLLKDIKPLVEGLSIREIFNQEIVSVEKTIKDISLELFED